MIFTAGEFYRVLEEGKKCAKEISENSENTIDYHRID